MAVLVDKAGGELFWLMSEQEGDAKRFVDIVVSLAGLDPASVAKPL
jgi:hypothetical protein